MSVPQERKEKAGEENVAGDEWCLWEVGKAWTGNQDLAILASTQSRPRRQSGPVCMHPPANYLSDSGTVGHGDSEPGAGGGGVDHHCVDPFEITISSNNWEQRRFSPVQTQSGAFGTLLFRLSWSLSGTNFAGVFALCTTFNASRQKRKHPKKMAYIGTM